MVQHHSERKISIPFPRVAEGNPAAADAIFLLLLKANIQTANLIPCQLPAIPARIFHHNMTSSAENSANYNGERGNFLRELTLPFLGAAARLEVSASQFGNQYDYLIAVQEHLLGLYNPESIQRNYPKGQFLFVPDVMPKKSGLTVIKRTGVRPVVWNQEAFDELDQLGMKPILVAPVLPHGFIDPNGERNYLDERVVIKASGSGMPKEYQDILKSALELTKFRYSMYLPNEIHSHDHQVLLRSESLVGKIADFYQDLFYPSPKVVVCYPSEMVQVLASMVNRGTYGLFLPARGVHEQRNLKWALDHGLGEVLDMRSPEAIGRQITRAMAMFPSMNVTSLGLGARPITELFV